MANYFGSVQGNAGEASRLGTKNSGITTYAASWRGAVRVRLYTDHDGNEKFFISMGPHHGNGDMCEIAEGNVGDASSVVSMLPTDHAFVNELLRLVAAQAVTGVDQTTVMKMLIEQRAPTRYRRQFEAHVAELKERTYELDGAVVELAPANGE